jgi:hypothetical protein
LNGVRRPSAGPPARNNDLSAGPAAQRSDEFAPTSTRFLRRSGVPERFRQGRTIAWERRRRLTRMCPSTANARQRRAARRAFEEISNA